MILVISAKGNYITTRVPTKRDGCRIFDITGYNSIRLLTSDNEWHLVPFMELDLINEILLEE